MTSKKPTRAAVPTVELHGKLRRIVLDEVSFSANRVTPATKGTASIAAATEIGLADTGDSYFASITIEVQALSEEEKKPLYSVKVKGTAFYSLAEKIAPAKTDHISSQAALRANLQLYPEIRRIVLGLVTGAGYNLTLPAEASFDVVETTKESDRAPAVEEQ